MRFASEKDVAQPVVEWLTMNGWDVYEEIKPTLDSGVADIVAVRDGLQWIIEVKRSLTLELMAQAASWIEYGSADLISIAVPKQKEMRFKRKSKGRWLAESILESHGIGIFEVDEEQGVCQASKPLQATFKNPEKKGYFYDAIRQSCHYLSKGYAKAGSRAGAHWTAFSDTCDQLREIARHYASISVKRAVGMIDHHYASENSAISSLTKWIDAGKVKNLKIVRVPYRPVIIWDDSIEKE